MTLIKCDNFYKYYFTKVFFIIPLSSYCNKQYKVNYFVSAKGMSMGEMINCEEMIILIVIGILNARNNCIVYNFLNHGV